MLRGVSESLTRALRATDTAGRYGGEEILVVLPQNNLEGSMIFAERWRSIVEESLFTSPEGAKIQVTISIGVAQFLDQYETADDLIAAADRALYVAKDGGRNRTEGV